MTRLRKIAFGLMFLMVALLLCGGAAIHFLKPRAYEWREVASSDMQFRISFPSNPLLLETNEKSTDGRPFVSRTLKSTPADRVFYAVSWWENPDQHDQTTEELFAHFRQCVGGSFRARLIGEKDLKVQTYPAKLNVFMSGNGLVENLVIRAGSRVYSLWVMDSRAALEKENIQRFLGSFRLEE
jgi:hypothetical protein